MTDTANAAPVWREATYTLKFPIKIDGQEPITTIRLSEPDAEALEVIDTQGAMNKGRITVTGTIAIIAALARLPLDTVRKVHRDDFAALAELAAPLAFGTPAEGQ